jgi:hypothetical protein
MRRLVSSCFCESAHNSSSDKEWPFTKYNLRPSDLVAPVMSMHWISRAQMVRRMLAADFFQQEILHQPALVIRHIAGTAQQGLRHTYAVSASRINSNLSITATTSTFYECTVLVSTTRPLQRTRTGPACVNWCGRPVRISTEDLVSGTWNRSKRRPLELTSCVSVRTSSTLFHLCSGR